MKKLVASIASALLIVVVTGAPSKTDAQTPLQIVWKTKLKFGTAASSVDGSGTIVINAANNTRSVTGEAFDFGGNWSRGKFQLVGEPKAFVIVTLPSSYTITNSNGNFSMLVDNIGMNLTNPIKLSNQGKKTVFIGARLNITTNQKAKNYNQGSFLIDADYL